MGTISRSTKQGGTTSLQDTQTIVAADVETDMAAVFTEINGEIDDGNIKTAEMPGAKSFRFTEITDPTTPSANDMLLYAKAVAGASKPTTVLACKDDGGFVLPIGNYVVLATSLSETTTATGAAVDLVTLTPIEEIQTNWRWGLELLVRKTTGAAAASSLGLKMNGTQVFDNFAVTSATNQAELGNLTSGVFSTATNYTQGSRLVALTSAAGAALNAYTNGTWLNPHPNAAITSIVVTGNSGSASITLGVTHVVVWAIIPFTV